MDTYHLLLGRLYLIEAMNTYNLTHKSLKVTLVPTKEGCEPSPGESKPKILLLTRFEKEMKDAKKVHTSICKEVGQCVKVVEEVTHILEEFIEVFIEDLPTRSPPLREIQNQIDIILGVALPNRRHYRMSPKEHEKLNRQVNCQRFCQRKCESLCGACPIGAKEGWIMTKWSCGYTHTM